MTEMENCTICRRPIKDDRVMITVLAAGKEEIRPAHGKCVEKNRRSYLRFLEKSRREAERQSKSARQSSDSGE
jgi:hypothetical protein